MHKVAVVLASILLLLGGTACGGGSGESSSTEDTGSVDADAPEAEDPDAEEAPDESGGDAVAVDLPGLPIGGNPEVQSGTLQCVDVVWTEPPDLPDWIGITVTGVAFTEGFEESSEPCPGGAPPCLGEGFQLTGDANCYVAVAFTGEPTGEGPSMSFSSGRINCPPNRVEECQAFKTEVENEGPQSIELLPPDSEFETDEGESEGETDPGNEGETDPGNEGETDPENTEESESTDDGGG